MTPWLRAAWRRVFGCRQCHGTGVIMTGECDCGGSAWSGHEPYCGTSRCPNRCAMMRTRDEAIAVWMRYWRDQPRSWQRPEPRVVHGACADGRECMNHCGSGPCSRHCEVCRRLAWTEIPPCPACPDFRVR